ncbi:M50 family metallopeptidase [Arsenicicoccus dermatophilus]|uniref:M50 family metallopeptidase n=1 Tax=Arsenicicoccus dermatophilus TaxID=1076331 RepID=UPI001F4CC246|nr:M50 family metallopeptidase [Arsenicicoccus dermatophilus]MCH8612506.1 M50 family metallopeptidase [Arsenicicoccus dermatophilus]
MSHLAGHPPHDDADDGSAPGWRLGSLRGTPIYLGRSWPILAIFVLATWGPRYPELGAGSYLLALAYALMLLVSVLAHEAGHALTAQAFGHRVHAIVADLMGGHTTYQAEANTPARSALVALAGPFANLLLAVVAWWLMGVLDPGVLRLLVGSVFYANAFVAIFNLLPGLPLDGGFVLDALVWRITGNRTTGLRVAGWCGRVLAVASLAWFLVVPLLDGQDLDLVGVLWSALLGGFLWQGASSAIHAAGVRGLVDRVSLDALAHPAALLPADAPVSEAIAAFAQGAQAVALHDATGTPVAVVDPRTLPGVPPDRHAVTPLTAVAAIQPSGWVMEHRPGVGATEVLEQMARTGAAVVLLRGPGGRLALLDAHEIEQAATA